MADIPLFPLPATIVFPGMTLPLYIFEARYKTMVKDVLASPDRRFAIALAKEKVDINDSRTIAYPMGTLVHILQVGHNNDGTMNIVVHGQERCLVQDINTQRHNYYSMPLQPYEMTRNNLNEERVVAWDAVNVFQEYAQLFYPEGIQQQIDEALPQDLRYQASFICANLHLDSPQKQALLTAPSLIERFALAQRYMEEQMKAFRAFDGGEVSLEDIVRRLFENESKTPTP